MTAIEELLRANRLGEAEAALRRQLGDNGPDPDSLRLLGRLCLHNGRGDEARQLFRDASRLAPGDAGPLYECGVACLAMGELTDALEAFRQALDLEPGHVDARFNLGWALRRLGRNEDAVEVFIALVSAVPAHSAAWFNLGNALLELEQLEAAERAFSAASRLSPSDADILNNLGSALRGQGRLVEAADHFSRAATLRPGFAQPLANLAATLESLGQLEQALVWYRKALALDRNDMAVVIGLALCRGSLEREDEAYVVLAEALRQQSNHAGGWNALGILELARNRHSEASAHFRHALDLDEGLAEAWNNLGKARAVAGDAEAAIQSFRKAHELAPANTAIHSNLIFHLIHQDGGAEAAALEAKAYGCAVEAVEPLPTRPKPAPNTAPRRLRIGYVSPDFRDHSVSLFFEPYLDHHDRDEFEIYCYCAHNRPDHVTKRQKAKADHWRDIAGLPDELAARQIRDDGIDILVDLAGHTAGNRLPIFAYRPAPIQATWFGYPGTTGLTRVDFKLTDCASNPRATEDLFSERLFRSNVGICFRPPVDRPPVAPVPSRTNGHIRFGSFNKLQKISPEVLRIWTQILDACPGSILVVIAPGASVPDTAKEIREDLAALGFSPDRLEIVGMLPLNDFLAFVTNCDVALDPWPYSGGTTSELTLMMGVPMVTLADNGPAGSSAGLLHSCQLTELIAETPDEYVRTALRLAKDEEWRHRMRQTIPAMMARWRTDTEFATVRRQEAIYRLWWESYLEGKPVETDCCYEVEYGPWTPSGMCLVFDQPSPYADPSDYPPLTLVPKPLEGGEPPEDTGWKLILPGPAIMAES